MEALASGQRVDADRALAELAMAAGLLLVAGDGLGVVGDRLPVPDPHLLGAHLHAELALEALDGDGDVGLADAAEDRLVGLVVAGDAEPGVLVEQAVEGRAELVLVRLGLGLDRHGQERLREVDGVGLHRRALRGERVAGDRARRASTRRRCRLPPPRRGLLLVAPHREQAVEALVGAGAAVHEVVVGPHRARQHLEQRDVADELVGDRLEHEGERLRRRDRVRSPRWWARPRR